MPARTAVRMLAPIKQLYPLQYKFDFWMFLREISHEFNGTHDKLVMAQNLKDIL